MAPRTFTQFNTTLPPPKDTHTPATAAAHHRRRRRSQKRFCLCSPLRVAMLGCDVTRERIESRLPSSGPRKKGARGEGEGEGVASIFARRVPRFQVAACTYASCESPLCLATTRLVSRPPQFALASICAHEPVPIMLLSRLQLLRTKKKNTGMFQWHVPGYKIQLNAFRKRFTTKKTVE